ncbi:Major Facilitator Superfamily protein [compost metagenome]
MKRKAVFPYIAGQTFAVIGVWMHLTMLSTLALRLTESALWLGVTLAAYSLPTLLFSWFVGALLNRWRVKTMLLWIQALQAVIMMAYALLLALDRMAPGPLMTLALLSGILYTVDLPGRQLMLTRLFGNERVMQAIALNSVAFNGARIVGPLLAGLFLVSPDLSWGFAVNGLLFTAAFGCLLLVESPAESDGTQAGAGPEPETAARLQPRIWKVLLLVFVSGLLLMNYNTLLPMFAAEQGDSGSGYSRLLASMGVGSLAAAVMITFRSSWFRHNFLIPLFPALIAVAYAVLPSLPRGLPTLLLLAIYGFFLTGFITMSNAAVLREGSKRDRAKLASVFNMLLNGFVPLGNMLTGIFLHYLGVSGSFYLISGSTLLFLVVWLAYSRLKGGGDVHVRYRQSPEARPHHTRER